MLMDTITAISTALSDGAIAIVRLSGEDAIEIANKLTTIDLTNKKANTINYGMIKDPVSGELVDEVLISIFKGPKSFSGEDMVEINCHGGTYVTKEVLRLCLAHGARLAEPGEFTKRAFLNGRINLTQAEAINDLIEAKDKNNARMAVNAISGSVTKMIEKLIDQLLDVIANIEVNIDYPEYDDVEILTNNTLLPKCQKCLKDMEEIIRNGENGQIIKEGIKLAIIGRPNVGKSSLLNALLEEDKAIVSDIQGTTRDIVEGSIRLNNVTLNLIDTAGIRESDDMIEKIGIERSKSAIEKADFVIMLKDANDLQHAEDKKLEALLENKDYVVVYNKKDLKYHTDGINISAKNNEIDELINFLNNHFKDFANFYQTPMLQNERQLSLMIKASESLKQAIDSLEVGVELDLVAIDLQNAFFALKEIIGKVSREDLLDTLFSKFCLGK